MYPVLLLFAIVLCSYSILAAPYSVRLGFLFPNCSGTDEKVESQMGFCTSASAALIALDRVKRERLLPNARVNLVWRFDECDESVATGMAIELLRKEHIDVLFGPPCTLASEIVSVIAKMYNKPVFSWAAPNVLEKGAEHFNTRVRLTGSGQRLGSAIKDLVLHFDWTRIAIFYSYNDPGRHCEPIIYSALKYFRLNDVKVVLTHESRNERPSDSDIGMFLNGFRTQTRIVILCNDNMEDDKRFLCEAQERKLVGKEFVYLIPDYIQDGDYSSYWSNEDKTGKWKELLQSLLLIKMAIAAPEQLELFKEEVVRRMRQSPFFYKTKGADKLEGSLYSPFLYDAVYLYALALNKTLEKGGSKTSGVTIAKNAARLQFQGMSGYVSIDEKSVRQSSYVLSAYDAHENLKPILLIATHKENPITLLVNEDKMWETRSRYKPKWYPKCGSPGGVCRENENQIVNWIVTCAAVLSVFFVCVCARCCAAARRRAKTRQDALMKWKISLFELEKIVDAAGHGSKVTVATEVSNVSSALARNDDRIVLLRGQLCYIKKHRVKAVVDSKEQRALLRCAALASGLIADDREWYRCMEEAAVYMMPYQLRSLFAILLIHCEVLSPAEIWEHFRLAMIEDFVHHGHNDALATTTALLQIQAELETAGFTCADKGLPQPQEIAENVHEMMVQNADTYEARGQEMLAMLNQQQRDAADAILAAIYENNPTAPHCFFIDGPGGTGKTFVYTTLINILRGQRKRFLAVAWTGIAAILLPDGQTCHSAFHLPLALDENSTCRLTKKEKERLLAADIIVWDEASMAEKYALEAVNRLLCDLTRNDVVPFGGKVMVLGGDFRQVLPVVPGASRAQIIGRCVKASNLWHHFRQLHLSINMRTNANEIAYAEWLQRLGSDTLPALEARKTEYSVAIPPECLCNDIVAEFFPAQFDGSDASTHQRVILSPFNEDSRLINERTLDRLQGEKVTYKSIDAIGAIEGEDVAVLQQTYPVEFLNTVSLPGLPAHALNLKKNAVVMIIRNLSIRRGLCNGTRLQILDLKHTVVKAKILSGAHAGTVHFIPRVTLDTKDMKEVPFNLRRRQFPMKLAYSMTINKAQGQTLDKVGVFLRSPVFTHGQLYVACSRVRAPDMLKIQVIETERQEHINGAVVTDNIVFAEVLD